MTRPARCPSCGNPPAGRTIFPDEPGGHFGTCADKYHDYPWLDEEPVCPSCGKKIDENVQSLGLMVVEICIDDFHLRPWPTREKP